MENVLEIDTPKHTCYQAQTQLYKYTHTHNVRAISEFRFGTKKCRSETKNERYCIV